MNDSDDEKKKTLDELISRALAYRNGTELKELFEFARRFPHYAPYNAMLLHIQNPGIRYALRAPDWERRFKRRIKPAVRPYVILQTMGPVAFVFDLSDTEPIDPAVNLIPEQVLNPFPAKGQPSPKAFAKLIGNAEKLNIEIETRDFATDLAGRAERRKRGRYEFHLALNSKHSPAQQFGALAHELGHIFCGHLGETEIGFWPDRREVAETIQDTIKVQEFEAEAVAFLVTDRMNLDIGSEVYLSGYLSSDGPLPDFSLDAVLKAAGKVEEMASGKFRLRKKK